MRNPVVAAMAAVFLVVAACLVGTAAPEPSPLGVVFNTAKSANVDVLAADVQPTAGRGSVCYRITVGITGANSVLNYQVNSGATAVGLDLNGGTALVAGRVYTFVVGAHSTYTYNFQFETSTTVGFFLVEEIRDGVI